MKKLIASSALLALILTSCGSPSSDKDLAKVVPDSPAVIAPTPAAAPMPYTATQTDDWKMGDREKLRTILSFYKNMEADTLYDLLASHIADTMTNLNFENKTFKLTPAQFTDLVKKFRSRFSSIHEEFKTYLVVHSDKLNYDQVMLWIKETGLYKNGKSDSTMYQENWRINAEGKIFYRGSYMRY
jgi:hypothetical protein